ncbi:MAG: hypothetical protein LC775_02970 [Acidobacteria bacterium]|nr:hypothetical protein [Acidobacteriota bacterium]
MQKPHLDLYISAEASDDERAAVAACFEEFDLSLQEGEYRFSELALTLVVSVFLSVASSAIYDPRASPKAGPRPNWLTGSIPR